MSEIKRGAGFCMRSGCRRYAHLRLIEPYHAGFVCGQCGELGHVEPEFGASVGTSLTFSEVRVFYGYDARERSYPSVAVATDSSVLGRTGAYTLFTPVVHSAERAQKLAEKLLARLNQRDGARPPARGRQRSELVAEGWQVLA